MNNLFSILLFLIVLLNKTYTAEEISSKKDELSIKMLSEVQSAEKCADILIAGFELVEDCLKEIGSLLDYSDSLYLPTNQNYSILRDFNIYLHINTLKLNFLYAEASEEKRKIADQISILSASHFLIPYSKQIRSRNKNEIKEKLGIGKSLSSDFFINCLVFDQTTNLFSASQFPAKEGSHLLIYQQIACAIQRRGLTCPPEDMREIVKISNLVLEIENELKRYTWDCDYFFTNFKSITRTYDALAPKFTEIQNRLIGFNQTMATKKGIKSLDLDCFSMQALTSAINNVRIDKTKTIVTKEQDRSALAEAFKEFAIELRNPEPSTIKLTAYTHVKKLVLGRLALYKSTYELLESKSYTNYEKLLLRAALSGNPNPSILELMRSAKKQSEVYLIATEQLELLISSKSQSQKAKCTDNLYILFKTHLKSLLLENPAEVDYTNLIIDFMFTLTSSKAKDFSDCMYVRYHEDYLKNNPNHAHEKGNNKDIIYFIKHDTAEREPTKSYKKLVCKIDLLKEQELLLQTEKINATTTKALTILTVPFEARIAKQMQAIDERVSKNKGISMFRRIYVSLLNSFTEVSPILTEYQTLVVEQMRMLESLLKKEPAYKKMKQREEDEVFSKIINEEDADKNTEELINTVASTEKETVHQTVSNT